MRIGRVNCVIALLVVAGVVGFVSACGPSSPGAQSGANRPLPAYSGHATELFDDAIEPKAVGLELEQASSPKSDPRFRERAQVSDVVVRARVSTVTGKVEGPETTYQVGFKVLDTLTGHHPVGDEFTVRFDKNSPSSGILKSFEGRLVGKTMVVFVRAFVRPDADHELHLHASADSTDVVAAVKEAVALEELGGK
jgi:hypothetical protein